MLLLLACTPAEPELVTLSFEVEAATISGAPFGLDDTSRLAVGTGTMAYELGAEDSAWDDASRGTYQHTRDSVFTLRFEGLSVDGSGTAAVDVEDFDPDTFRFSDGVAFEGDPDGLPGPMSVDGEERQDVDIWFAVTEDAGTAFSDDLLPSDFPTVLLDPALPHTFSVEDEGGTVLFQLLDFQQTGWPE
jgi:hypothetical protein